MSKNTIDYSQYSIESYLNGSHDPIKETYYIDPVIGKEVVNILADSNTDHGYFMMESLRYLGEANTTSSLLESYIGERQMKIRMCKAFEALTKDHGYNLEYYDFWYSLESEEKSKSDSNDTWYKKIWETIKAVLKQLVLAIINFIKTVGNFLKGALCKAQEVFYKKYAKDVFKHIKDYEKNADNHDIKIKIRSVSEKVVWDQYPWEVLKKVSQGLVKSFSDLHKIIVSSEKAVDNLKSSGLSLSLSSSDVDKNRDALLKKLAEALNTHEKADLRKFIEKMKHEKAKWFPSVKETVNLLIYGKENPSKHEMRIIYVITPHTFEILSPAALTQMTYAFKTAQQANKSLMNCLKHVTKMEKQNMKFEGKDLPGKTKDGIRENAMMVQRISQFTSSILIQLYGTCLSARMSIYSAAKKLYKKGEYEVKEKK